MSGGHEILRRIFVTVRDKNWAEVPPTEWRCSVDEEASVVRIEARHRSDSVEFEWHGILQCSPDLRSIDFAFEGRALRDLDICRLGLVTLHPVNGMVGAKITARAGGEVVALRRLEVLPVWRAIAPQPIINGVPGAMLQPFSELSIATPDGAVLDLRFEGDMFELEDQRNWGDDSFKTYCTPLRAGFPRKIAAGTRIAHRIAATYTPATNAGEKARSAASSATSVFVSQAPARSASAVHSAPAASAAPAAAPTAARLPRIGCTVASLAQSALAHIPWQHLHLSSSEIASVDPAARIKHIEISAQGEPRSAIVAPIAQHRARLARLLIYGDDNAPPSATTLQHWQRALQHVGVKHVPVFAAVRGYFVELNRGNGARYDAAAGLAFPLTPTVHGDDPVTVGDNAATIIDMAETARTLGTHHASAPLRIALAPLALYYPTPPATSHVPNDQVAAWLAATLMCAALAGVDSITLDGRGLDAKAASLLATLAPLSGAPVSRPALTLPEGVHALSFNTPGHPTQRLIANVRNRPAALPGGRNLAPYEVRWAASS